MKAVHWLPGNLKNYDLTPGSDTAKIRSAKHPVKVEFVIFDISNHTDWTISVEPQPGR